MIEELTNAVREIEHLRSNVYNDLGDFYFRKGDFANAKASFLAAVAVSPYYATAYMNAGEIHVLLKEYGDALKMYDKAVECNPSLVKAYYKMALAYYNLGDFENSVRSFKTYLARCPSAPETAEVLKNISILETMLKREKM